MRKTIRVIRDCIIFTACLVGVLFLFALRACHYYQLPAIKLGAGLHADLQLTELPQGASVELSAMRMPDRFVKVVAWRNLLVIPFPGCLEVQVRWTLHGRTHEFGRTYYIFFYKNKPYFASQLIALRLFDRTGTPVLKGHAYFGGPNNPNVASPE